MSGYYRNNNVLECKTDIHTSLSTTVTEMTNQDQGFNSAVLEYGNGARGVALEQWDVLLRYSLRGEVGHPPMELVMKKSAIWRRARRLAGLFPLFICSWIRPSSSSLKA